VLIHGLSQDHQCWVRQYQGQLADDFRLVAFDLRGHGMSEVPTDPAAFTDGKLWADDLAAVIDQLGLDHAVLVGWSYGPFLIGDYLRAYGDGKIAALAFVGGAVRLGPAAFGSLIGPGFLDHFADLTAEDLPTSIRGVRGLVHAFAAHPLPSESIETLLCAAMAVPATIRGAMGARDLDYDDVLRNLRRPLLVSHGRSDRVVLPAMAQHVLNVCPTAEASWYDGVGHVPFLERPDRFNDELAALIRRSCD
jgi:pimeloyl-ACP methyl ester carboxylesterase